jgi:hypothetical protein
MAAIDAGPLFVLRVERVKESIDRLLSRDTHPFFIAYLHLRREAGRVGQPSGLVPEWSQLGDLLRVTGAPDEKPYLRPLWSGKRDAAQEWLNRNLAGSYAASSIRAVRVRKVISTDAEGAFALKAKHWDLALEHLLIGKRIDVVALAAFLFRDFGFVNAVEPQPPDLVEAFRSYYRYRAENDKEFDTLHDASWTGIPGPWFEPFASAE